MTSCCYKHKYFYDNIASHEDDSFCTTYLCITCSQQDTLTKNYEERNPEYDYAAINKLVSVSVPHQATTDGVQYAVSTKTASKEGQDELPPLEDSYATVDKEKVSCCKYREALALLLYLYHTSINLQMYSHCFSYL